MIMKASHNPFLYRFFSLYTVLRIRAAFKAVFIEGGISDRGMPVLVIANHFSWWDGFWIMYMNMKIFRRKLFFMMLEEQLRKNFFLNRTGGYSVKKGSRSIIESVGYTIELLADRRNMVLLFPQGKIESARRETIRFGKGILRIARETTGEVQVIFAASFTEYYSHPKPSLFMYLSEFTGHPEDMEAAYNQFYSASLVAHTNRKEPE